MNRVGPTATPSLVQRGLEEMYLRQSQVRHNYDFHNPGLPYSSQFNPYSNDLDCMIGKTVR